MYCGLTFRPEEPDGIQVEKIQVTLRTMSGSSGVKCSECHSLAARDSALLDLPLHHDPLSGDHLSSVTCMVGLAICLLLDIIVLMYFMTMFVSF